MRVFVTELNITPETATALFSALPKAQAHRAGNLAATVGFLLVRYALRQYDPALSAEHWQKSAHGKPFLAGTPYHFNLSHSRYGVAVAVSDRKELGIDIEEVRPHPQRFAARYFSEAEQALVASAADPHSDLVRIWTAKEAEAKRLGTGLSAGIAQISTDRVASTPITLCQKPHWLSVSPANAIPTIERITAEELLK